MAAPATLPVDLPTGEQHQQDSDEFQESGLPQELQHQPKPKPKGDGVTFWRVNVVVLAAVFVVVVIVGIFLGIRSVIRKISSSTTQKSTAIVTAFDNAKPVLVDNERIVSNFNILPVKPNQPLPPMPTPGIVTENNSSQANAPQPIPAGDGGGSSESIAPGQSSSTPQGILPGNGSGGI